MKTSKSIKVYTGVRHSTGELEVFVDGKPLPWCLDIVNHSPTGFECGYAGSGPAQLALALAMDHLGKARRAERCHQELKRLLVAQLPRNKAWEFDSRVLAAAIETAEKAYSP